MSLSDCPGCSSLRNEVKSLKDNHETLKDNHETLKDNHETLKENYKTLKDIYDTIQMKVASLEAKDQFITIREICRAVEKKICMEAVGSTKMKKGFFCFSKFESNPTEKARLDDVLTKYQVSAGLIMYLTNEWDKVTHDDRNKLTVAMLDVALHDDEDDAEIVVDKRNFISALHQLGMVGSDGIIMVK